MPGGIHAPTAETLPKGAVQVSTLTGLGRRTGLLGPDHKFNRAIGDIAVAYGVHDMFSVGLSLDGRYDRHWGLAPSGDDGYVGDPKLILRAAKNTGSLAFGGQLGIWIPGKDAPSVAASAISVDVRGLVSLPAGPGLLSFSAGFRLDNSAKSVDDPDRLSLQDRVSLGVSDYHAIFGGAQLRIPAGDKAWVGAEGTIDAYVGGPPEPEAMEVQRAELPRGKFTIRGGVTAGFHITDAISAFVFMEAAKAPGVNLAQVMANNIPLVPYEPIFTGGIGLAARFGASGGASAPKLKPCALRNPPDCDPITVPITTELAGTVTDAAGKPIVGAKVLLTLSKSQVEPTVTDEKGAYVIKGARIGQTVKVDGAEKETIDETAGEVSVSAGGYKPNKATVPTLAKGSNQVPVIILDAETPPGELRGVIRSLPGGKPLQGATVEVEPGGQKVESQADGTFQINLAPGSYKIKVSAPGKRTQELDVTIETNGVAIKNIDLQ
jgi:hypothetical protein